MTASELSMGEEELRAFCGKLLSGAGEASDTETLLGDPDLAIEAGVRLAACGVKLIFKDGTPPLCVVPAPEELPELPLACLALCVIALGGSSSGRRPRIDVKDLHARLGRQKMHSESYIRRAGLGPLEARGLVKVVKPEQRATEAYVVAGPALAAIDREAVAARLKALTKAS